MGSTFADPEYGDTVESQLTLGTVSLLGIFFGLVMVCGIFFGFGYSIGRRNAAAMAAVGAPAARPAPAQVASVIPAPVMAQPAPSSTALLTTDLDATASAVDVAAIPPAAPISLPAVPLVSATTRQAGFAVAAQPLKHDVSVSQPGSAVIADPARVAVTGHHSTPILPTAQQPAEVLPATTAEHAYIEPKERIAKPSAIQPTIEQPTTRIPLQRVPAAPQFTAQNLASPYLVWTPPFDVHYRKGSRRALAQIAASQSRAAGQTQGHSLANHTPLVGVSHPTGVFATAQPTTPQLSPSRPALTVQVAALSRQDDAEVLVSALRERGFAPSIQSGSEDALYHVQVGPFSRDVAFATRQRLIARGYNATLK